MASPSLLHQLLVELAEKQLNALLPADVAAPARAQSLAWTSSKGDLGGADR